MSRRPGQSQITTPRKETDTCRILSGVSEGYDLSLHFHGILYSFVMLRLERKIVKCWGDYWNTNYRTFTQY